MFSNCNSANEVQQMTMTVSAAMLSSKKNRKLISKLLAKGFMLTVKR